MRWLQSKNLETAKTSGSNGIILPNRGKMLFTGAYDSDRIDCISNLAQ